MKEVAAMFALRNVLNHELYSDDVAVEGEFMYGIGGWTKSEDAKQYALKLEKEGKYYAEDWDIVEIDDKKYYAINDHLNNDNDFKAFYYKNGLFEILNTRTGKLTRFENEEE